MAIRMPSFFISDDLKGLKESYYVLSTQYPFTVSEVHTGQVKG